MRKILGCSCGGWGEWREVSDVGQIVSSSDSERVASQNGRRLSKISNCEGASEILYAISRKITVRS